MVSKEDVTSSPALALPKQAAKQFAKDKAPRLAAALAFYTVLSLGPLLLVLIGVVSLVWGPQAATQFIVGNAESYMGEQGGRAVGDMLAMTDDPVGGGIVGTVVGVLALLASASLVAYQLRDALGTVWDAEPQQGRGAKGWLVKRVRAMGTVVGLGFVLLAALVAASVISAMAGMVTGVLPGEQWVWLVLNTVVMLGVLTVVFAMVFKFVPDVELAWKDAFVGAAMTAVLFEVGRIAIGVYMGFAAPESAYGAAGALLMLILWIYYSAMIFLFGAELTQAYAERRGSGIRPDEGGFSEAGRIGRRVKRRVQG